MNHGLARTVDPILSFVGLERLAIADSPGNASECSADVRTIDWDRINAAVQEVLSGLADRVHARHPEIRSQTGHTSARYFFLYSYRVFDLGGGVDIDPVIVGVNFEPVKDSDRVRVYGDVSGEGTGRIDFEVEPVEVRPEMAAILEAAEQQAAVLAGQEEVVTASVLARHSPHCY